MQPYIFRYASIINIEVFIIPLIPASCCSLFIVPVIVSPYGNHVFATKIQIGCQVETYRHHPILMQSDMITIHIKVSSLTHSFKLNKHFFSFCCLRQFKVFTIPRYGISHVFNADFKSFIFIKSMWQRYLFPIFIRKGVLFCSLNISYV